MSRRALLLALVVGGVVAVAAVSALAGRDRPAGAPPPLPPPTTAATTAPPDAPLSGPPVGALDVLPEAPTRQPGGVLVAYATHCDALLGLPGAPRAALLAELPVAGSCAAGWSAQGRFVADAISTRGVRVRDRTTSRSRVVAPTLAAVRGSVRVDDAGDALLCTPTGRAILVRAASTALDDAGRCPAALRPDGRTLAVDGSGAVVGRDARVVVPSRALPNDVIRALAVSPDGGAIAVLGEAGNVPWVRTFGAADGRPIAGSDDVGGTSLAPADGQESLDVSHDGRLVVVRSRDVHVARLDASGTRSIASVGKEGIIDAAIAPDGRTIAVATTQRVVLLDAATFQPLAGTRLIEAIRLVWLDRTRLG